MNGVLRFITCLSVVLLLFCACEKQETLSGTYQERGGQGHTIVFTDHEFCYNNTLSGQYTVQGERITLKYNDGVIERHSFRKSGDEVGDSLWMDDTHYIKVY